MTYSEFLSRYNYELYLRRFSANFLGYYDGLACYSYGQHSKVVFYLGSMFKYVDFPVLHSPYDSNFHHLYFSDPFNVPIVDRVDSSTSHISYARTLVGKYFLSYLKDLTLVNFPTLDNPEFPPYVFDTFDDALEFCGYATISGFLSDIFITRMISISDTVVEINGRYVCSYVGEAFNYLGLSMGDCCSADFVPVVKALGGTTSYNQLQNLKIICQLLGVDTNTSLDNCEAMKEYLRRIVQILGGSPLTEPNDNLKSICQLLGIDSNENGLTGCELSKDYVKRISKMLGAE